MEQRGWHHRTIEYSELEIPNYADNPVNRCFFCKDELYRICGFEPQAFEPSFAALVEQERPQQRVKGRPVPHGQVSLMWRC